MRQSLSFRDREFVSMVADRIVEITPSEVMDGIMGFDDFIEAEVAAVG